jgi:predicted CXXCH cytochrome family protein
MRRYLSILGCALLFGLFLSPQHLSARRQAKDSSAYRGAQWAKSVAIPGAERVGSEACTTCHTAVAANFRHAFHAQQGLECEDCHGAGSLHIQGGGDIAKIVSFRLRSEQQANAVCLSCHAQDERIRHWIAGPHASNGIRCSDCHQTHAEGPRALTERRMAFDTTFSSNSAVVESMVPESKPMLQSREQANENCLRCHQAQRAQMSMPYHHPLREGKMSCVDCHDPHGGAAGNNLSLSNGNQLCLNCHAQYRGPFMYQHPPVTENCLKCHTPHGSPNTNLLTVSEPALCLQCHTGHHNGAGLPLVDRCTNCHGSIHGSDVPAATGGSVFIDKGAFGVPSAQNSAQAARKATALLASHRSTLLPAAGSMGGALGFALSGLPSISGGTPDSADNPTIPQAYTAFSVAPGSYRFISRTGYSGRVGEYDSLQQSAGANVRTAYVLPSHNVTVVSSTNILTADDYQVASQLAIGEHLQVGFDTRSFFQQQDNYPFYSNVISPDILADQLIPSGTTYGVKRRLGKAYARFQVPKLPLHLFVKGDWQARVGTNQLAWFDMGGDPQCGSCHFASQPQTLNYTTRHVAGGAEVKLRNVSLTWQHDFRSFNDRLRFPAGAFGATLMTLEPVGNVADTVPGTYVLDVPAPNQSSADTVRLNWNPSSQFAFNGHVTYTRARDLFTKNTQNAFDSYVTANWRPLDRLRFTAHYGQQNLLNEFTPFYTLFGNMSYHQHNAGLRIDFELVKHLDLETRYERRGITRSNSALWPQFYSINNTDLRFVVPTSFSNTTGLALRYHSGSHWSARAGYEWTGTRDPGFLTDPRSNNRSFADLTLSPFPWLIFTNDISILVQNAFPAIERRNRFYLETADATLLFGPNWNLELGYSYQQNNLSTYMGIQNDSSTGYVLQEPFVPYKQLSRTYWAQLASKCFRQRLGFNARVAYNSAYSAMRPDLNPNDAAQLGNATLIQQGLFDPVLFQQALDALNLGATQISEVKVPQWIGSSKVYYLLPRGFNAGVVFYYGNYRDYWNPGLNGTLRTFSVYVGRSW